MSVHPATPAAASTTTTKVAAAKLSLSQRIALYTVLAVVAVGGLGGGPVMLFAGHGVVMFIGLVVSVVCYAVAVLCAVASVLNMRSQREAARLAQGLH